MRDHTRRHHWLGASLAAIVLAGCRAARAGAGGRRGRRRRGGATDDEGARRSSTSPPTGARRTSRTSRCRWRRCPTSRSQAIFSAGADITALAARVPGLFVESSNGRVAPRFYIRGLGNTDFDLAASQPVSVVMDDVVMENVTLKSFPIFDVERIEVLRGPQGTLFGRNTPAGIVKIDTRPADRRGLDARGSVSFGSYGTVAIDAGVGGPIVDGRAGRRASRCCCSGAATSSTTASPARTTPMAAIPISPAARQLLFTPSDRLSVLALGQYRNLDGQSTLFRANILGPGQQRAERQLRPRDGVLRRRRRQPRANMKCGAPRCRSTTNSTARR